MNPNLARFAKDPPAVMKNRLPALLTLTSLMTTLPVPAQAEEDARRLITVEDHTAFQSPGSPAFSPDGQSIAYTVSTDHYDKNETLTRIWIQPAGGATPVPMTSAMHSSRQPVFSLDGKTLYFLSARDEQPSQLWTLDLETGGEAVAVTDLERGVNQINFSSDQNKLLLVLKDEDAAEPLVEGSTPWVVDRLTFKADYTGYLDHRRNHIYVYDIESAELTQLTSGDYDHSQPAWSPDDQQVAFVSNRGIDGTYNTDIWLVDANGGAPAVQLTSNTGADASPVWHPEGEWLVTRSAKPDVPPNYAVGQISRVNVKTREQQWLSEALDRNVNRLVFADDGRHLYFLVEDSGEQHVARMKWADGAIERPVRGPLIVSEFAVHDGEPGGHRIAAVVSSDLQPVELFVQANGALSMRTQLNSGLLDQLRLGATEEIHYQAPDGWEIEGFVTVPPDFERGRRYPAILRIHGGPVGQYGHGFSFEAQILAAQGYVVIRTNPRGSSGYGEAFTTGLWQGWGEKDYQDVLGGVDHVIELGYADPERLGMGGYSYGGILTNYLLGKTDRFKAAVSGAGSGHYLASYGHDEYRYWYESELGLPWENRELWERLSPFNYIHQATTPTLFYAGEKDWNVPVQGSEQLYQVMKRVGVETVLIVYPGEHHGGWSFQNERDALLRMLGWYERFLK